MMTLDSLTEQVLAGKAITKEEALWLYDQPLEPLCQKADQIRAHFCQNGFDLCTIINGKSGRCSENCRFCAQSAHHSCQVEEYPLLSPEEILAQAKEDEAAGTLRYSIVTSGKRLTDKEVDQVCDALRKMKDKTGLALCGSFGLLNEDQFRRLKEAGLTRVHNNLEASRNFFPQVCTTHAFEDKIHAIKAAQAAGLAVCSGGIVGMGETPEDRIDMAITLRELEVKSIPVNMLNPIPGTPLADQPLLTPEDMRRIVAVYRFLLPDASIRLAGGRGLLPDKGKGCFQSGANAAISGNMLTTAGYSLATDLALLEELDYEPQLCHG